MRGNIGFFNENSKIFSIQGNADNQSIRLNASENTKSDDPYNNASNDLFGGGHIHCYGYNFPNSLSGQLAMGASDGVRKRVLFLSPEYTSIGNNISTHNPDGDGYGSINTDVSRFKFTPKNNIQMAIIENDSVNKSGILGLNGSSPGTAGGMIRLAGINANSNAYIEKGGVIIAATDGENVRNEIRVNKDSTTFNKDIVVVGERAIGKQNDESYLALNGGNTGADGYKTGGTIRLIGANCKHSSYESVSGGVLIKAANGSNSTSELKVLNSGVEISGTNCNLTVNGTITTNNSNIVINKNSGAVYINGTGYKGIIAKSTDIDYTSTSQVSLCGARVSSRDKSDKEFAVTAAGIDSNGKYFYVSKLIRIINGEEKTAEFGLQLDKDGSPYTFCPTPASNSNSSNIATTKWVNDKVNNYAVKKSGDTMTGSLTFNIANEAFLKKSNTTGTFNIYGGKSYTDGGCLILYGKDHASYPSRFTLSAAAADGKTRHILTGTNDGRLLWKDKNVLTEKEIYDYVIDSDYDKDTGNWYRIYKSGWVEQGGIYRSVALKQEQHPIYIHKHLSQIFDVHLGIGYNKGITGAINLYYAGSPEADANTKITAFNYFADSSKGSMAGDVIWSCKGILWTDK